MKNDEFYWAKIWQQTSKCRIKVELTWLNTYFFQNKILLAWKLEIISIFGRYGSILIFRSEIKFNGHTYSYVGLFWGFYVPLTIFNVATWKQERDTKYLKWNKSGMIQVRTLDTLLCKQELNHSTTAALHYMWRERGVLHKRQQTVNVWSKIVISPIQMFHFPFHIGEAIKMHRLLTQFESKRSSLVFGGNIKKCHRHFKIYTSVEMSRSLVAIQRVHYRYF